MKPLPMPLRLAAGLVATAIEEVQELPKKLIELPVTAVSQILQVSMRMQQRVTELAIKGDQALGSLRPVPETPTWARFDEDESEGPFGGGNGLAGLGPDSDWDFPAPARTVSPIRVTREPVPAVPEPDFVDPDVFDREDVASEDVASEDVASEDVASEDVASEDVASEDLAATAAKAGEAAKAGPKAESAARKPTSNAITAQKTKPALESKSGSANGSTPTPTPTAEATPKSAAQAGADPAVKAAVPAPKPSGPSGFEDYESWTLPQLRGRFRAMSLDQVQALLDWETSHQDRPPYVTMLSNRAASITGR